jgi:hypothetical protein
MTIIDRSGPRNALTPPAMMRSASMSSPESVSSRMARRRLHHGHLEDLVALLLAATEARVDGAIEEVLLHVDELHRFLRHSEKVAGADLRLAAGAPHRVERRAQEVHVVDARDLDRVLETHEDAGSGARLGRHLQEVGTVERDRATDVVAVASGERVGERALARAVGAHDGVHLAGADIEVEPLEDLLVANGGGEVLDVQHQPTLPSRLTLSRR